MVHLVPHWTWPERVGQVTPVHVFTSGDEAELYVNGHSLGRKSKGRHEYRLRWDDVVYEPGEIRVVAYKDGERWAEQRLQTAGEATTLELTPDRDAIRADGRDLAFVSARVTDRSGLLAPRDSSRITFRVTGPGVVVATDNGDASDFDAFPSPTRRAFNGRALAIIRAHPGELGTIKVVAEANGLTTATACIAAVN